MRHESIAPGVRAYYLLKPLVPRSLQLALRRHHARHVLRRRSDEWPILPRAARPPPEWPGWPQGKKFAFVVTHDVERLGGVPKCRAIMDCERAAGIRSAFNFVPGDYSVPAALRQEMRLQGFEVGVHGWTHSGHLFDSPQAFSRCARSINATLHDWDACGFRAPAMHHKLDWIRHLDIDYDSSTFDTDPFEPQPDGFGTIFPFRVDAAGGRPGYIELPYTLPQDFTLFVLLRERSPAIWQRKLDWIAEQGGMVLFNSHPDYMRTDGKACGIEEYPIRYYQEFLEYVQSHHAGQFWQPLPREMAAYCRTIPRLPIPHRPRRVCMVSHSFYENDCRIIRYARSLLQLGDHVDCIASRQKTTTPRRENVNGVQVLRVHTRRRHDLGKIRHLTGILSFLTKSMAVLAWRSIRHPYDLVHVHSVPDFLVFAAWPAKLRGSRVLLDIHDVLPELYASRYNIGRDTPAFRMLTAVERASGAFADHVIVANHIWHGMVTQRSVPVDKCSPLPNYIDTDVFPPRQSVREPGRFRIVHVGCMQWHQGLDLVIRAVGILRDEIPGIRLDIYGNGPEEGALSKLVASLGLSDRVRFRGLLPHTQVADELRRSDLGIVARRNDVFGSQAYCSKILEYMSQGVPVIASNVQTVTHYFDGSSTWLIPPDDLDALVAAIRQLAHDEKARANLTQAAYACVRRDCWAVRGREYHDIVNALTKPPEAGLPPFALPVLEAQP